MIGRFVNQYSGIIELLPYFTFEINTILRIVYKDSQSKKTSMFNIVSYAQTSLIDDNMLHMLLLYPAETIRAKRNCNFNIKQSIE